MPEGQVLEFSRLTKRFGSVHAVSDLTARVEPGAVTGFLGPNGAGKTTTLRMLLGLVRPSSGTATIGGAPYAKLKKPLQTVGAVLEASSFHPGRTGANHLKIYAQAAGLSGSRIDETLGLVGLADAAGRKVGGYSLGMRQRLGLAYALLGDPGVLVLDEPANGLDPEGIKWLRGFLQQLAREGRTVLVSSHLLAEVQQTADAVLILADGRRVFNGSISELVDPAEQVTIVDSGDRAGLVAALRDAGIASEVLRSGVTVRTADPAEVGRAAAAAGIPLIALQRRGPALEEVFLELVSGVRVHPSADAAYDDRATSMDAGAAGVAVPGVAVISAAEATAAATSPAQAGAVEAAGAEAAGAEAAGGEAAGGEAAGAEAAGAETSAAGAVRADASDASATEANAPEATSGSRTAEPVITSGGLVAPAVAAAAEAPDEDTEFDAPAPAEDAGDVREEPRPAFAVAGTGVIDIVPTPLPAAGEEPDHTEVGDTEADDTADTTRDTSEDRTGDAPGDGESSTAETAAQQAGAPIDSTEARAAEPGDQAVDEPGDELDAGTAHVDERDDNPEGTDQSRDDEALDGEDFEDDDDLTEDVESAYVTHSAHAGEDERTESDLAADAFFSSFDHRASGGENATAGGSTDDEVTGGNANAESGGDDDGNDAVKNDDSTDAEPHSDSPGEPEAEHPDEQHPEDQHPDEQHPEDQHPDEQHPDEQHPDEQHPDEQHPEDRHPDEHHSTESPGAQPDEAHHDEEGSER